MVFCHISTGKATGKHVGAPRPETPFHLPPHPASELSQSTSFGCPSSGIELALVIYFTYGNVEVSMLFSLIIPPSPSPKQINKKK